MDLDQALGAPFSDQSRSVRFPAESEQIAKASEQAETARDARATGALEDAGYDGGWIAEMNKVMGNYPGIEVVATVYGDDLADKSYREAQGLEKKDYSLFKELDKGFHEGGPAEEGGDKGEASEGAGDGGVSLGEAAADPYLMARPSRNRAGMRVTSSKTGAYRSVANVPRVSSAARATG